MAEDKFEARYPFKGVVHLRYRDKQSINDALKRIQEYYESPFDDIRGQRFTAEQFAARYPTYSWDGFNFPGRVMLDFFSDHVATDDEEAVDFACAPMEVGKPFYVIGTWRPEEYMHEVAHAMWYLREEYQRTALRILVRAEKKWPEAIKALRKWLVDKGYDHAVLEDECNAYLSTSLFSDWMKDIPEHAHALYDAGRLPRALLQDEVQDGK